MAIVLRWTVFCVNSRAPLLDRYNASFERHFRDRVAVREAVPTRLSALDRIFCAILRALRPKQIALILVPER
jgi:hypothetical protein